MAPIRKGDGTSLAPKGIKEVRKGDGTTIWTAIPDSEANQKLVHRWVLDDVGSGTVTDSVGSADGTVNGAVSESGSWAGNRAANGDGTDDYISTTTLGSFGSNMDTDFAVAFSIQTTDSGLSAFSGVVNSNDSTYMYPSIGAVGDATDGELSLQFRDSDFNIIQVYTDGQRYDDGNPHRVVFNKTSNSASGVEIWINQTQVTAAISNDQAFGTPTDFDSAFALLARNNGGSLGLEANTILDDFCLFGDSLTQSEIESYQNPWA